MKRPVPGLTSSDAQRARRLDIAAKRFTASQVPKVRDALLKSWESGLLLNVLTWFDGPMKLPARERFPDTEEVMTWTKAEWHDFLVDQLPKADLFYVDGDMTDLVVNAAAAVPSYQVFADRLPAECGFVVYERPYCKIRSERLSAGQRVELTAAFWMTVPDIGGLDEDDPAEPVPGVMLVTLQDSGVLWWTQDLSALPATRAEATRHLEEQVRLAGPVSYHDEYPLPFGDRPWGRAEATAVANEAIAAVQATWTLMHQRITDVTPVPAPRHLVERAAKRGERPPPEVRVVTLAPRAKRAADPERQQQRDGEPSRRYTRRWTVQSYGYWRDTWYPSKQRHEQQWVEVPEYVKGPEGAPWVPPKVRTLRKK